MLGTADIVNKVYTLKVLSLSEEHFLHLDLNTWFLYIALCILYTECGADF